MNSSNRRLPSTSYSQFRFQCCRCTKREQKGGERHDYTPDCICRPSYRKSRNKRNARYTLRIRRHINKDIPESSRPGESSSEDRCCYCSVSLFLAPCRSCRDRQEDTRP